MKLHQCTIAILIAGTLAGATRSACADEAAALTNEILVMDSNATNQGSGVVTGRIAADFESFAGSKENSTALVSGLRNGSEITLVQKGYRPATFTPPTRPMGYGNVSTSLSLAQYQLAQQGITNPSPVQLKIALNGGTITAHGTTVTYDGILQMRADGMGWGQIAQQLGTKLGPIVSGIKAQNANISTQPSARQPATAGITSGAGTGSTLSKAGGRSPSGEGKGIVNASGGSASGVAKGKNDTGVATAGGKSSAPGRGIVSASGQAAGSGTHGAAGNHGAAGGQGVVTGASTASGSAAGGGSGHGKALGHSK